MILEAPENFEVEVVRNGISYYSLSGNIQAFINSPAGMKTIAAGNLKELMEGVNQLTYNSRRALQQIKICFALADFSITLIRIAVFTNTPINCVTASDLTDVKSMADQMSKQNRRTTNCRIIQTTTN